MGNSDHVTTYMREGDDEKEFPLWHYIYACSVERKPKLPQFGTHASDATPFPEIETAWTSWSIFRPEIHLGRPPKKGLAVKMNP